MYTSVTELGPAPIMSRNTSYDESAGNFELDLGVYVTDDIPSVAIPEAVQSMEVDRPILFGDTGRSADISNRSSISPQSKLKDSNGDDRKIDEESSTLCIPGDIVHLYVDNGVFRATICDFNFESFNEMKLYQNMISDHSMRNYRENIRSALFLAQQMPLIPEWQVCII